MNKTDNFAVISTGGKQYKVHEGDTISVELLEEKPGDKVSFPEVLLVQDKGTTLVGSPYVDGASVTGKVEEVYKDDKVIVFKKKRRKGYKKTMGHRQMLHKVMIEEIAGKAKKTTEKKAEPKAKAAEKKPAAKKPAAKKTAAKKPATKKAAPAKSAAKAPAAKAKTASSAKAKTKKTTSSDKE